eukprot:TRINITY_DN4714_c0_g1_i1.p1 TRINITY_DN4714_c0_g1~~TRINITY_DN4714_c0_g1_i1.p1  ORF type:complete len:113 (-),score=0.38 TRINITY_DN4714_c0_g1_i1:70-408(-)
MAVKLWLNEFQAYPGVHLVGEQHITSAHMHIKWYLYASPSTLEEVVAFYDKAHPTLRVPDDPEATRKRYQWRDASDKKILEVCPRNAPPVAPNLDYLVPSDKCVILVSEGVG